MVSRMLIVLVGAVVAGCARVQPEEQTRQIAAECSLLDYKLYYDSLTVTSRYFRKYEGDYRKMIAPGYRFRISTDPEIRARLLSLAMREFQHDQNCRRFFWHWARDKRIRVRDQAVSCLFALALEGGPRVFEAVYEDVLAYLRADLPAEYVAHVLSVFSSIFDSGPVPESVLQSLEARAKEKSEAGSYLKRATQIMRENKGRFSPDVGSYPEMVFELVDPKEKGSKGSEAPASDTR